MSVLHICQGSLQLGVLLSDCTAIPQQKAAILLAIRELNNKTDGLYDDILPSETLQVAINVLPTNADVELIAHTTSHLAISSFGGHGVTAILGPDAPRDTQVSHLALSHLNTPQLHYSLGSPSFSEGIYYPHFMRLSASDAMQGHPLVEILEQFQWKHVFVVYSVDDLWEHVRYNFAATASEHRIHILGTSGITSINDISTSLTTIRKSRARVIVLLTSADHGVAMIQEGYDLGVFGQGMQFIGSDAITSTEVLRRLSFAERSRLLMGYIGVQQRVALTESALGADFVTRWRAQSATRTDDDDGSVWCSNATDGDGQYIYYDVTSPQNCSGLNFSSFAVDGSDIHSSAILAYDATISLALAIHNAQLQSQTLTKHTIYNAMTHLQWSGISGKICFSDEFSASRYGLGDRHCGVHYEVLQYHAEHDGFVYVAEWNSDTGYTRCDHNTASHHNHNCESLVFNTKDVSEPPRDGPEQEHEYIEQAYEIILSIAAVGGMCSVLMIAYLYYSCAKLLMIRLSQPVLCYLILVGALCGCLRVFLSQFHVTQELCSVSLWLSHMCFTIIYSTLVMKTWKVHRVMNSGMKKVRITTRRILLLTLAVICVSALLLLAIQVIDPPSVGKVTIVSNQEENIIDEYCVFERAYGIADALYTYEGSLVLYGLYLIYVTRRIPSGVSDSSKLRQVMVTVIVLCGAGAIVYLLDMHPHMHEFIVAILFSIGVLRCLYILFAEVAYRAWMGYDIKDDFVTYVRVSTNKYTHSIRGIVPIHAILSREESSDISTIRVGTMTQKQAREEIQNHEEKLRALQNYLLKIQSDEVTNSVASSGVIRPGDNSTVDAGDSGKQVDDKDTPPTDT